MKYIQFRSTAGGLEEARKIAAQAMRDRRIAKGHDPDVSPDGKPYVTQFAGSILEGRDEDGKPTGNALWVAMPNEVKPKDAAKEVPQMPDEFKPRLMALPEAAAANIREVKPPDGR